MKKIPSLLLLVVLLWLLAGSARAEDAPPHSVLDELVAVALADNPELKAAQARWHFYEHKVVPAASLADPALSFAFSNYPVDTFSAGNTPMTGNIVRLFQEFPFPGKLGAREEAAAAEARWYKGVWEDNQRQLVRQVKQAYFSFYFYEKAVAVTDRNLRLLKDFIRLTETNYEVGKGLQQDVLKAQVEYSKLTDTRYGLQQKRETALAELNRLLGKPPATPLARLEDFGLPEPQESVEALQEKAATNRPLYAAYKSLAESYKAKQRLARLNYLPDFKVGVAYTFREPTAADNGTDFASLELGINLPLAWGKRKEASEESNAGLTMVLEQYRDFRNKVLFNIQEAYSSLRQNREQARLYRSGLMPQAAQSFEAALSGYRVGKVGFLPLLDSLLTLQGLEIEYFRRLTDGQRSLAKLEAESGVDFALPAGAPLP